MPHPMDAYDFVPKCLTLTHVRMLIVNDHLMLCTMFELHFPLMKHLGANPLHMYYYKVHTLHWSNCQYYSIDDNTIIDPVCLGGNFYEQYRCGCHNIRWSTYTTVL